MKKPDPGKISSPCINECNYDARTYKCLGCGRGLDEIKNWENFSEAYRQKRMKELAERATNG